MKPQIFFTYIQLQKKCPLQTCEQIRTQCTNFYIEHKLNKGCDFMKLGTMPQLPHHGELSFLIHPLLNAIVQKVIICRVFPFSKPNDELLQVQLKREKIQGYFAHPIPTHSSPNIGPIWGLVKIPLNGIDGVVSTQNCLTKTYLDSKIFQRMTCVSHLVPQVSNKLIIRANHQQTAPWLGGKFLNRRCYQRKVHSMTKKWMVS